MCVCASIALRLERWMLGGGGLRRGREIQRKEIDREVEKERIMDKGKRWRETRKEVEKERDRGREGEKEGRRGTI